MLKMVKATLLSSFVALSGCILVVDDAGEIDSHWATSGDDSGERYEADRRLATRVKDEIEFDDVLRHENIEVRAHGDVVSLHGRVSDLDMLGRAVELAASVEGVETVRSRLTVEYRN